MACSFPLRVVSRRLPRFTGFGGAVFWDPECRGVVTGPFRNVVITTFTARLLRLDAKKRDWMIRLAKADEVG